jgi:hypothetical protein
MREKFILRLFLLIVFSVLLYSCVHDEINSSTDPSSKEYHSKSLWKEDEVYIKNVMQVYFEHENDITKGNGIPLWDYAMTMGYANESFLLVPIADGNKIISCLQVPRNGGNITFMYENDPEHLKFFQGYTTLKDRRPLKLENFTSQTGRPAQVPCKISSVSMWYPDDEYGANGHWETHTVVTCPPEPIDGEGGETNPPQGPTYPYPGGGNSQPQQPKPPCEKTKDIIGNPKMQAGFKELKDQSTQGGEKGIKFKADGTPSATITGDAHSVNLGDKTGYEGGYHNHTPTGIPMFSPPDIDQLLGFAKAQPTSNPANINNAYLGMIAPNGMHYVIQFTGTYQDAIKTFSQEDLDNYKIIYQNVSDVMLLDSQYSTDHLKLNAKGVETLFFDTLKKMGLDGKVNLQRIEDNQIKNINLDSNNQPIPTACP